MDNNTVVEPVVEPVVAPTVKPEAPKQLTKKELLREISEEYGVNMFDAEGVKKFKEFTDSQKTELEKVNEKLSLFEQKESEYQTKLSEYESKLKASELGIPQDKLEDALKLAGGNPDKLAEVIKKYPIFVSKEVMQIGVQQSETFQQVTGLTEQEKYMAANPKIYKPKK